MSSGGRTLRRLAPLLLFAAACGREPARAGERSAAPAFESHDEVTYSNGHPLSTETSDPQLLSREDELLRLANDYRLSLGLPALIDDPGLRAVARAHAKHMSEHYFAAHVNPEGDDPGARLNSAGLEAGTWGENLAVEDVTPEQAFERWLQSPGHRANIIDPAFTRTGTGYWTGGPYARYYTQLFTRP